MARQGALESLVMDVLWDAPEPLSVREVLQALTGQRPLAYTTVLTVLTRLHGKGRVIRAVDGVAHRYRPAHTRAEVAAAAMAGALEGSTDRTQALLHFAARIGPADVAALRRALDREG